MKRVIVYDYEQKKPNVSSEHSDNLKNSKKNEDVWSVEKRKRAMKTIENAGVLSDIVKSIETLKLKNSDEPVLQDAVEKISSIVEEMKLDFKKDYWE